MNSYKYLKINYRYSIHLVLMLFFFGLLSTLIFNFSLKIIFFLKLNFILPILRYIFPFLFLFIYIYFKNGIKFIKWNKSYKKIKLNIYIITCFLTISTIILNEYIINIIPKKGFFLDSIYNFFDKNLKEQLKNSITFFINSTLLAPFFEEFFFRKILLNGLLKNNIFPLKAILFSSFLFGFIHMNPWQFIAAFLMGNVIGLIYFRTHSFLLCIISHALNNGISFFITFFYKEEKIYQWINSNIFIIWIGIIFLIISLCLLFIKTNNK